MSVLIIANTGKQNSGAGRYTRQVLNEYDKRFIKYGIISYDNGLLKNSSILNFIKNIITVFKLSKEYKNIHAFDAWPFGVYAVIPNLFLNKRLFINGVGSYSVKTEKSPIKNLLMKVSYQRAYKVLAVSRYVSDRISDEFNLKNVEIAHLGLTLLEDISLDDYDEIEKKYHLNKFEKVFLTVGAIKERKGQFDTLQGISLLKKDYPNFCYVMVGSDLDVDYINKIKNFAQVNGVSNNIKIISGVPSGEEGDKVLTYFYKTCDVFCLNSNNEGAHFEGFGLVFLEAAQFGKPSIGSNGCGIESAIENGKTGLLSGQKNHVMIASNIKKILDGNYLLYSKEATEFSKKFPWSETAWLYSKYYIN